MALRYQIIELLLDEGIGDMKKPNRKGLEPFEIEHC